jgi:hypothetical protein
MAQHAPHDCTTLKPEAQSLSGVVCPGKNEVEEQVHGMITVPDGSLGSGASGLLRHLPALHSCHEAQSELLSHSLGSSSQEEPIQKAATVITISKFFIVYLSVS